MNKRLKDNEKGQRVKLMLVLDQGNNLLRRHLYFLLFALASSFFLFWGPLRSLVRFAFTHDYDSHIFLIVPISAYLIYRKRHEIFSSVRWDFVPGVSLFLAGAILGLLAALNARFNTGEEYLWLHVLALVLLWISGFIFCYGIPAFRTGRFSLLFLLLLVPIPDFLVGRAISWLQDGSAFVAFWPVMREGLVFHVPSLDAGRAGMRKPRNTTNRRSIGMRTNSSHWLGS